MGEQFDPCLVQSPTFFDFLSFFRQMMGTTNLSNAAYQAVGDEPTDDLVVAKVTSMLVLGIVSFLIGIVPTQLTKCFKWNLEKIGNGQSLVVSLLLCFGGGVLMFTTFLHLQPEVREGMEALYHQNILPDFAETIQLPELIFCVGFFFVYFIEEAVHGVLDHRNEHTEDEVILHRTMSVRRCKDHEQPTLIPRVSLGQSNEANKSTQILIDSSSVSTIENDYLPKIIDPDSIVPKFLEHDSHFSSTENSILKSVRAFCTILALSFHAVFEGLAVGLEDSVKNVWYLTLAVAAHKFVISFCVGVELLSSKTKMLLVLLYVGTFAVVTPIGIGIGIALAHSTAGGELVTVIFQGMAAGTLLYVVFFEVLQRERSNEQSGILQLLAIILGFGAMFGLQILSKYYIPSTLR